MKKLIPGYNRLATANLKLLEVVLVFGILVLLVAGFAPTWTQTSAPTNNYYAWIASSPDGKIVCAITSGSPALLSTNGGDTWTTNGNPAAYAAIATSADGTKLIMSGWTNGILVSTNSGNVWNKTILPDGNCLAVASSADGTKLVAAIRGGFNYASTNSGATWITNSAFNKNWESIASSADGKQVVAAVYGEKIYVSTNLGMNWTATSAPIKSWNSICSSSDGRILAATADDGTSISTNSGSTWITTNIFGTSIACSADGTRLVLAGFAEQIWTSADSGMTWATNNAPSGWHGVASSADGCKLLAVGSGSPGVWVGNITPSPQLNVQPTNGKLAFSWTVPSTNFVLQQNLDLTTTNWVTQTNAPTLNLTNLHNEITLSPSNGGGFFRLSAPP
jgi:photosystem II stability/assembly factor-like uncharacterized protein